MSAKNLRDLTKPAEGRGEVIPFKTNENAVKDFSRKSN